MSKDPRFIPRQTITLGSAKAIAAAAEAVAAAKGFLMAIAILDDGGHLIHFSRMDGVHVGTAEIAIAKARTAVAFRRPTRLFGEQLASGVQGLLALPGLVPFDGGLPLMANGVMAGAIGVSGGKPADDGEIAAAGARWLEQEPR